MRILIVAPHADDETIGMGGTITRYAREGHETIVAILTGHGEHPHPLWPKETWDVIRNEAAQAHAVLGVSETIYREIPAAQVADQPAWELNKITSALINEVSPDILYVPFPYDLHKDHREIFHSCSVAWRTCTPAGKKITEIYAYEVMSETHWNAPYLEPGFLPHYWVDITDFLETKLAALRCFTSQIQPSPNARSLEAMQALALWRGSQVSVSAAEAFVLIRAIER